MNTIFKALVIVLLSRAQAAVAEIDLDNFFAASKVHCQFNDDAVVEGFKQRFISDRDRLELGSCHVVYQLLGVLAAQVEESFRTLASDVLASYEKDRSLLAKLTGYSWATNGSVARNKDKEVVDAIQAMQFMQENPHKVYASEFFEGALTEINRGSFFQRVVFAVHAPSIFDLSRPDFLDIWGRKIFHCRESIYFSLLMMALLKRSSRDFVRWMAAGRTDLADSWLAEQGGMSKAVKEVLILAYCSGIILNMRWDALKEKEWLLSEIPELEGLEMEDMIVHYL